jgi:3-hydroxyacyl-CoA dehydrogenase
MQNSVAAVIGAGLIGRGWAIVFARAGWQVKLYDINADALQMAQREVSTQLNLLSSNGLCDDTAAVQNNIHYIADLAEALDGADYVQECGPEVLDAKRELFDRLDQLSAPETILASSSSGLMTSEFAEKLQGRQRALVVHPVNPPHLVPLVELSPASWTDPAITQRAHDIMTAVGQSPIIVQKEIAGFILNRLQGALLNEALRMVQGGYATADDVDKTLRDGLGLRWSFMGPFETIDLNAPGGLGDYADRYGGMYQTMAASQATAPDWTTEGVAELVSARSKMLDRADIGKQQDWRDNRLAALIAHKQSKTRT